MKIRLLVASIALFTSISLSVATEYCITVHRRTNLRDDASLESNVLETAASGTTLSVIAQQNRWLKVNRNGRQLWMANWVDYSRLESCGEAPAQPQTAIDNCCFVDRQCQSNQDWTDGYWAFQNGQCPTPAQSQTGTAPPASNVLGPIDNCCYTGWNCQTALEWEEGYWAFQNGQCPTPAQSQTVTAPPVSNVSGPIDNCCYTGWNCQTALEWEEGYYAFQNGQCPTPAQSQTVTAPPVSNVSGPLDNCCRAGWNCQTALEWEEGYYAYRDNRCGLGPGAAPAIPRRSSSIIGRARGGDILPSTSYTVFAALGEIISRDNCCEVSWQCNSDRDRKKGYRAFQDGYQCALPGVLSIVGDSDFIYYYEQRLEELRRTLPHRYNYVLDGLDKIEQEQRNPWSVVDARKRIFYVDWGGPSVDGWEKRDSAVLVHEACHVHRYDAGFARVSQCDHEAFTKEEIICREIEVEVLIELNARPDLIEWGHDMVARTRAGIETSIPEGGC